jgi:hypothetical protein
MPAVERDLIAQKTRIMIQRREVVCKRLRAPVGRRKGFDLSGAFGYDSFIVTPNQPSLLQRKMERP